MIDVEQKHERGTDQPGSIALKRSPRKDRLSQRSSPQHNNNFRKFFLFFKLFELKYFAPQDRIVCCRVMLLVPGNA